MANKNYKTTIKAYYSKGKKLVPINIPHFNIPFITNDENQMRHIAFGVLVGLQVRYKDPIVFADQEGVGGHHFGIDNDYAFREDSGLDPSCGQFAD